MNTFISFLSTISDVAGALGAFFALFAWLQARAMRGEIEREKQRLETKIVIRLHNGTRRIVLPISLRRRELTRAEVLGRIGMLPMREPGKRFSLAYLATPQFLEMLDEAQTSIAPVAIDIPATPTEIEQFAL